MAASLWGSGLLYAAWGVDAYFAMTAVVLLGGGAALAVAKRA